MTSELETAAHPETLKRVVIEPVTRVEGHGKVTLLLDEDNQIPRRTTALSGVSLALEWNVVAFGNARGYIYLNRRFPG
jgi:hypothetical protein